MSYALVIDDNRQTADSVCQMLNLLGIETQVAYGPRSAMLTLADRVPEMVFLDINMPGVSGYEILAYLRREPGMARVPVIVISSEDQSEMVQEAAGMGIAAFIPKPFTLEEVVAVLRREKLLG